MPSARDIADYFLAKTIDAEDAKMTNLKLQKLLYYAQGFHLALFDGQELFSESLEAWTHGPVCPEIYRAFKEHGANIIPCDECEKDFEKIFSEEKIEFLDEIYEVFGQFSAWKLRNMTHEEKPWINNKDMACEISKKELEEYFKTRVA